MIEIKNTGAVIPTMGKFKYEGKSQYKNVYLNNINGELYYKAKVDKNGLEKMFKTEREAALAVDKYLISKGKDPVNILKRK